MEPTYPVSKKFVPTTFPLVNGIGTLLSNPPSP